MHNDDDDIIESALNSKLLSINLRSQRLDKKKQEVKNVVEQSTKRRTRIAESLQNFRVIHKKRSISLNNTSQISPVNAIIPVLPTEDPEYSLSMGYENLCTPPEMKSDEVIKSSVEKIVPIPSEYEVTSDNERECDVPVCEDTSTFDVCKDHSKILSESNDDDNAFEDIEYVEASSLDSELVRKVDYRCYERFSDDSSNDPLLEEVDLFLATDNSIPPGIENFDYDSKGDIYFLEELLVDDSISIPKNESSNFDHHDNPRPPSEPLNAEFFFDFEPNSREVIAAVIKILMSLMKMNVLTQEERLMFLQMLKMTITFPSYLSFEFFYHISSILRFLLYFSPLGVKTPFLTLASSFRAGGISLG
uniref:Uncharacterized protein n=1 Tax=Tanacetum cinerariifolium TaxID=118510 RepID=A0A6L2NQT3_TANCI|nr:hypothetical protein [Tanacetum cinerariifolium]